MEKMDCAGGSYFGLWFLVSEIKIFKMFLGFIISEVVYFQLHPLTVLEC